MAPIKKKKKLPENEIDYGKMTLDERSYYEQATQTWRSEWEELWKLYIGELPPSKVKSLSRNFIPKTHQAVEASASFLVGNEPTIIAIPVGAEDDDKAKFMGRLLEFQWQYILKMKPKVLTWVKSGLLFGVGIMKVGWDATADQPFAYPVNLGNFYTDPFTRDLQEAPSVIERIVLPLEEVKRKYGVEDLMPMATQGQGDTNDSTVFDSHDIDNSNYQGAVERVEILERWTMDHVYTVALQQTKDKEGNKRTIGKVLRDIENPYGFIPYVPFRPKDSPLPNRFYNQGVISPVKRVHKRMNQLVNQIVDNTNLIMSPAAKVRRGSGVNYREVGNMFPGKVITMNDIERDVEFITIPDTTGTGFNLYNSLDNEFKQGTTITDLRQGSDAPNTAGAARIQQSNLNTQTTLVKENVEYAVAEMGQMLCKLNIDNITNVRTIRIFDPEDIAEFDQMLGQGNGQMSPMERQDIRRNGRVFTMDKGQLDGDYDIRIKADSTLLQNRDVLRKQLIDFSQFLNGIGVQLDVNMLAEKWGELSGIPNASKFIRKETPPPPQAEPPDPTKILQALADLAKAGEPISNAQLQAAMQKCGLPPNMQAVDPMEAAPTQDQAMTETDQPQLRFQTGPGGGMGMEGPTPSDTSVGVTNQGAEDAALQPSAMTQ